MSDITAQMKSLGHLTTQAHEFVKQHVEYDGQGRTEYVYTTRADALNGSPCSVVRYSFDGVTSNVVYMKEYAGTWNTAWEVF